MKYAPLEQCMPLTLSTSVKYLLFLQHMALSNVSKYRKRISKIVFVVFSYKYRSVNDVCKHYSKWCSVFFRVLVSSA